MPISIKKRITDQYEKMKDAVSNKNCTKKGIAAKGSVELREENSTKRRKITADIQHHHHKGKSRNTVTIGAQKVKKKDQIPLLKQKNVNRTIKRKLPIAWQEKDDTRNKLQKHTENKLVKRPKKCRKNKIQSYSYT